MARRVSHFRRDSASPTPVAPFYSRTSATPASAAPSDIQRMSSLARSQKRLRNQHSRLIQRDQSNCTTLGSTKAFSRQGRPSSHLSETMKSNPTLHLTESKKAVRREMMCRTPLAQVTPDIVGSTQEELIIKLEKRQTLYDAAY